MSILKTASFPNPMPENLQWLLDSDDIDRSEDDQPILNYAEFRKEQAENATHELVLVATNHTYYYVLDGVLCDYNRVDSIEDDPSAVLETLKTFAKKLGVDVVLADVAKS